jgi:CheY-like chemotaxis protein
VRSLAVKVLARRGYSVLEAGDATECLEILKGHEGPLDLLLTDVVMPGMNGRELFTEVEGLFPGTKVLYMSGYTEDIITHRGVLDEGIAFLQKPFSVQALSTRVRAVLDED